MARDTRRLSCVIALVVGVLMAWAMHHVGMPWVHDVATYSVVMAVFIAVVRPGDFGWPPPVRITAAELIARGARFARGAIIDAGARLAEVLAREHRAVDVAAADAERIAMLVQQQAIVAGMTAARYVRAVTHCVDAHVGVYHVALVARAVPAPRSDRVLAAAA